MILTHEHEELRRSLRRFVETEIDPNADAWEEAGIFPAHELFRKAGAAGFLSTMVGSTLLLAGRIDFQQSLIPGLGGFGLIGLWVLINGALGLADGALPRSAALAGVLLGLSPTIILILLLRIDAVANVLNAMANPTAAGFQMNPVVMALTALGMISYAGLPIWFIAVGRLFATGRAGAAVGQLVSIS